MIKVGVDGRIVTIMVSFVNKLPELFANVENDAAWGRKWVEQFVDSLLCDPMIVITHDDSDACRTTIISGLGLMVHWGEVV